MDYEYYLTDWFPPYTVPGQIGVYQTCDDVSMLNYTMHGYQYWNGYYWGMFNSNPTQAQNEGYYQSEHQDNYWRGLCQKSSSLEAGQ